MRFDEFDARMRRGETFHGLRVPPGAFIVVRVDGRAFSRLTARLVEKPFDVGFHRWMIDAAKGILTTLHAVCAFTESDEISVLLPRDTGIFDREVEKLVSISAARAAAVVSVACGQPVEFDGRLWIGGQEEDVVDYFRWRQADAGRCSLSGWCYWTLRSHGTTAREAARILEGASFASKHKLLRDHGVDFDGVPAWQRRGTALLWERCEKPGFDPRTGKAVVASRRKIVSDSDLPTGHAYAAYVRRLIASTR